MGEEETKTDEGSVEDHIRGTDQALSEVVEVLNE